MDFEARLAEFENQLSDLRLTGSGQDNLRWPRRYYAKFVNLISLIESSDFRPTDQQVEVYEMYQEAYQRLQEEMQELRGDLKSLNQALLDAGIQNILLGDQLKKN
jgi:Skp family chaperone for outer membrane proteins